MKTRSLSPLKSGPIRALQPQVIRLTGDDDVKNMRMKPSAPMDPGREKKAAVAKAQGPQAMKPSKLTNMSKAKKKERG